MTKSEIAVMTEIVRGRPYWGEYGNDFGQTMLSAARNLSDKGLARIVHLTEDFGASGRRQYVAIAPNAEWDFKAMDVRSNAGANRRA